VYRSWADAQPGSHGFFLDFGKSPVAHHRFALFGFSSTSLYVSRDGTGDGYDLGLTRCVASAVDIPVIASGGVGSLAHLADGLDDGPEGGNASAVLAASIFHFGQHTVPEAKKYLAERGILVRPPEASRLEA